MDKTEEDQNLMSKVNIENETSMEEVLASIRQIISEDIENHETHSSKSRPPQVIAKHNSFKVQALNEDVLDLTDVLSHDGTVVRLKPKQERKVDMKNASEIGPNLSESYENILDLVDAEEESTSQSQSLPHDDQTPLSDHSRQEAIFSPETVQKSVAALKDLNKLNEKVHDMISNGSFGQQTMEEFMLAIMKPMLKTWMDAHLPSLVKWVVAEQIEKLLKEKQESTAL
ncbi:MAG: DUF2497 domain-containing protein [Alphaproteobacteria bacterium]|nr:DUF2497 domain-containing protein [Alphaproteobacteria bacterium]